MYRGLDNAMGVESPKSVKEHRPGISAIWRPALHPDACTSRSFRNATEPPFSILSGLGCASLQGIGMGENHIEEIRAIVLVQVFKISPKAHLEAAMA